MVDTTGWRDMLARVMYSGGPCNNELYYWLAVIDNRSYTALKRDYPPATTNYFTVCDACYDRVYYCLSQNATAIRVRVPDLDKDLIASGMTVALMEHIKTHNYSGDRLRYQTPSSTGDVGPYTVTIDRCTNGFIYGITEIITNWHIAHQSVDATELLQDEEQTSLDAGILVSVKHENELDADIALQGNVPTSFDATMPLQGPAYKYPVAYLALRDIVSSNLTADGNLALQQDYPVTADEVLAVDDWSPFDADICVQTDVPLSLTAGIVIVPDSEAMIKVDLEKYLVQKFRIFAEKIPYEVFNSETDDEVVP